MQNDKLLNYLHLHFIVFIWGFTAVLGALISIEAIPLVWYRMLLASLFVLLFIAVKRDSLVLPWKVIAAFCFIGLLIAMHWFAFFAAIKSSNVSITLAMMSTGAFFTSILEPIFFKRKVKAYEVIMGLIVVLGLYIIFNIESGYFYGIVLGLSSAFLGALFAVLNGKYAGKYSASVISFYELFFGMICLTIYLLFTNGFTKNFFSLSEADIWYLFILASICTAYAFIASLHIMKWLSPYTVMLTVNLEPVYGIILALLILDDAEYMSPQFYMGAIIILITVIINGYIKTRRKKGGITNT